MKILFFTIVLDGLPFLPLIYSELRKLPKEIEWEWVTCEGVAKPVHCTRWVAPMRPRLSNDGTTEYLNSLFQFDTRATNRSLASWNGKIEMVNFPLRHSRTAVGDKEFLLWQMDSDELFSAEQIHCMWDMFRINPQKNAAYFWCRYFVGPDKVTVTRDGKSFGNYAAYEWLRVWKIKPGMLFRTHEPPVIEGLKLNPFTHAETEARGLVFDHFSFATRAQVVFKEQYYAGANNPNAHHYKGLVERWEKFQTQTVWPRPLREVMPWAEANCMVTKI